MNIINIITCNPDPQSNGSHMIYSFEAVLLNHTETVCGLSSTNLQVAFRRLTVSPTGNEPEYQSI